MSDRLGSVVDASDRADVYDAAIELQLQMADDAVAAKAAAMSTVCRRLDDVIHWTSCYVPLYYYSVDPPTAAVPAAAPLRLFVPSGAAAPPTAGMTVILFPLMVPGVAGHKLVESKWD